MKKYYKSKTPEELELERKQIEEYARLYEAAARSSLSSDLRSKPVEHIEDTLYIEDKPIRSRRATRLKDLKFSDPGAIHKLAMKYPSIYERLHEQEIVKCTACGEDFAVILSEHMDTVGHSRDPGAMKETYTFYIECPECSEVMYHKLHVSDEFLMQDQRTTASELEEIKKPRKKKEMRLHTRYGEGMNYDDLT
jgi:hypothetical protein